MTTDIINVSADLSKVRSLTQTETHPVLASAASIVISDDPSYHAADLFLFRVRQARSLVKSKLDPLKAPINEAHKQVMRLEHELDDPLAAAEREVKGKMAVWQEREKARARAEEEARQRELNRKAQEEARLAAEADLQRRVEAQAAYEAQQARTAKERREAQERAEAARRESERLSERQRLTALEVDALEAVKVEGPVKAAGSVVKEIHTWEVEDLHALIQAVARGERPDIWLQPNEEVIDAEFKRDAAMTCSVSGIKHVTHMRIAGR